MDRNRTGEPPLHEVGEEPDHRFSYANERTFLAWIRTSLALIAAGLGIIQLLPDLDIAGGRRVIGLPLLALAAVCAVMSLHRWEANERAMRLGRALPSSRLPQVIAFGVTAVAGVALVLAAVADEGG